MTDETKQDAQAVAKTQAEQERESREAAAEAERVRREAERAMADGKEDAAVKRMRETGVLESGYTRNGAAIYKTPGV